MYWYCEVIAMLNSFVALIQNQYQLYPEWGTGIKSLPF